MTNSSLLLSIPFPNSRFPLVFLLSIFLFPLLSLQSTEVQTLDPKEGEKDAVLFYWKSEYNELLEKKRVLTEKYNELLKSKASRTLLAEETSRENLELQRKIRESEERSDALLKEIDSNRKNTSELEKEISSLKVNLAALNSEYLKLKDASAQAEAAKSKIASLEKEIAVLKTQKESAEKNLAKMTELEAKMKALETEKAQLLKSSEDSKLQLSKVTEDSKSRTYQNSELESKIKSLESSLQALQVERNKLIEDMNASKSSSPPLMMPLNAIPENYVSQLEKTILELETEQTNLTKNLSQLKEETIQISNLRVSDLKNEIQNKSSELKEDENKLVILKEQESNLEEDWKTYRTALNQSNLMLAQNLNRIEELEKQLISITQELDELKKKNESINSELEDVRKDYEAALGDLATAQDRYNEEKNKYLEEVERLNYEKSRMEDALEKEVKRGDLSISKKGSSIIINLNNAITFKKGSAILLESGKNILSKLSASLKNYNKNKIYIEGNTDSKPINTEKFKDNWHLSFERAYSVFSYLRSEKGVSSKQFALVGMGEFNPLKPNSSEKNRQINRRVEIIITPIKLK
jgi:chemotaxis protein MotB